MTQQTQLKAGVIGAGVFGGFHANKYAEHPATQLVTIFDPDINRAKIVAEKHGAQATDDLAAFLSVVDVVTVASPADTHAEMALAALSAGKPVYVEKPLAITVADAERIAHFAKTQIVACGHQERAVFQAMGLLNVPEVATRINACREGPWSGRGADVSVTLDLMVHDLDLVNALGIENLQTVTATGRVEKSKHVDHITADFAFAGAHVELTASRIAPDRKRQMTIEYPSGVVFIDFMTREFNNTTPFDLNADFTNTHGGKDPLATSVGAFIDTVADKRAQPLVTAQDGLAALRLAKMADEAALKTETTA